MHRGQGIIRRLQEYYQRNRSRWFRGKPKLANAVDSFLRGVDVPGGNWLGHAWHETAERALELLQAIVKHVDPLALESFDALSQPLMSYEYEARSLFAPYRDHIVHSAFVYLLGLYLADSHSGFGFLPQCAHGIFLDRRSLPGDRPVHHMAARRSPEEERSEFFRRWCLTAAFHDLSYGYEIAAEELNEVSRRYLELSEKQDLRIFGFVERESFRHFGLSMPQGFVETLRCWYLPADDLAHLLARNICLRVLPDERPEDVADAIRVHYRNTLEQGRVPHSFLSALSFLRDLHDRIVEKYSEARDKRTHPLSRFASHQRLYCNAVDAAGAIVLHDLQFFTTRPLKGCKIHSWHHPVAFMLKLADELQRWCRPTNDDLLPRFRSASAHHRPRETAWKGQELPDALERLIKRTRVTTNWTKAGITLELHLPNRFIEPVARAGLTVRAPAHVPFSTESCQFIVHGRGGKPHDALRIPLFPFDGTETSGQRLAKELSQLARNASAKAPRHTQVDCALVRMVRAFAESWLRLTLVRYCLDTVKGVNRMDAASLRKRVTQFAKYAKEAQLPTPHLASLSGLLGNCICTPTTGTGPRDACNTLYASLLEYVGRELREIRKLVETDPGNLFHPSGVHDVQSFHQAQSQYRLEVAEDGRIEIHYPDEAAAMQAAERVAETLVHQTSPSAEEKQDLIIALEPPAARDLRLLGAVLLQTLENECVQSTSTRDSLTP